MSYPYHLASVPALDAALVTVVFWASAFVAIRHAGHEVSARGLAPARLAVPSIALGAVVLAHRRRPLAPTPPATASAHRRSHLTGRDG
jgi:hypothetical protein